MAVAKNIQDLVCPSVIVFCQLYFVRGPAHNDNINATPLISKPWIIACIFVLEIDIEVVKWALYPAHEFGRIMGVDLRVHSLRPKKAGYRI